VKQTFSRAINGILLLDKPLGVSSNHALQSIKKTLYADKAGHTGSLDPLASGMLPICLGAATRYAQYLLNADKCYKAQIRLGQTTTTGDREGKIVAETPLPLLGEKEVAAVLKTFLGPQQQCPPMYSALKHQGKRLYELARQGIEVERPLREIEIHSIKLLAYDITTLTIEVHCSKGTYIRTLAEDIGKKLECGAHLAALHRLSVAGFNSDTMLTLDQLQELSTQKGVSVLEKYVLPMDKALTHYPSLMLSEWWLTLLKYGKSFVSSEIPPGLKRLYAYDGQFKGLVLVDEVGRIKAERLLGL
jgi:tRNA pseudouridine55 synthase